MRDYKTIARYEEQRMKSQRKAYIVFECDKQNKYAEMLDEYDEPTAVYATTTKAKAEKYIIEHKDDETFDYFIDVVEFEG